ncbi:hypothetical protein Peur_069243 [Populus x canadensis]|jgi:hypothetical protein
MASYYLDGAALYWHQKCMRSLGNHAITWEDYVEALCCRFRGQKDPLEELMELRQIGALNNGDYTPYAYSRAMRRMKNRREEMMRLVQESSPPTFHRRHLKA